MTDGFALLGELARRVADQGSGMLYRNIRPALTGKLNDDNDTVNPNAAYGQEVGFINVRVLGERTETRARNIWRIASNVPVLVGESVIDGELWVIFPDLSRVFETLSTGAFAMVNPDMPSELRNEVIQTRNIEHGRIRVISGLEVAVSGFWYYDSAGALKWWDGGNLDSDHRVTLTAPANADEHHMAVVALNPDATTPALTVTNGTAVSVSNTLSQTNIASVSLTAGYIPLWGVRVVNGDTTVNESRLFDARPWIVLGASGGAAALDDLTDVDVSTTPPNDGEALVYDSGDNLWKPGAVATSVHNHTDAASGGQLTDAALSAAVGIAKGGTGQTTQSTAFDALSPLTTKGDLIARNSTTNTRLPVGANNRVLVADSAQATGLKWSDALLALTKVTSGAFGGQVRNESGATANEGDVGYLDYDTNCGMVYKTTTTAGFDPARVCVVLTAGSNGGTIYVTQKAANVGVNYTGTAPAAGEFLITSLSAGLASRLATMHPRIFAVCLSAGSSGTVAAMLLTRTQRVTFDPSDDILRVENHSDTAFTSTISGAPSPTSVTYGAITSGAENVISPSANTQLGKMRLWNTTRNSYRLIRSVNTATNTITTVSSTDTWANGDSITILSQTTSAGTAADYIEVDLSQTTEIPLLARSLDLQAIARDTGAGSMALSFHPYQTYFSSKVVNTFTPSANVFTGQVFPADLYNRVFTFRSASSGSGTKTSAFKVLAYNIAVP